MNCRRTWLILAVAAAGVACTSREIAPLPEITPGTNGPIVIEAPDLGGPDVVREPDGDPDVVVRELDAIVQGPIVASTDDFVLLDGSASTGAVRYRWDFGNGDGWAEPREQPNATLKYPATGRYTAVLTVWDADGESDTASVSVGITHPLVFEPQQSSTIIAVGEKHRAAVLSPDSNELLVIAPIRGNWGVEDRLLLDRGARTLVDLPDWYVAACETDATILFHPKSLDGASHRVFLPVGTRPFGVVTHAETTYASLQATGEVVRIEFQNGVPRVTKTAKVIDDARGLARLPDGRILVSRWRSGESEAEVAVVSPDLEEVGRWTLAVDPQPASDVEIGGLPSYLGAVAVSPTGREAVVPSLQANVGHGSFLNGLPLTHEHAIRAIASFIDPDTGVELFERRKQWDDRGLANSATYTPAGDYLWVTMRGNRAVERYDVLGANEAGTILEAGFTIEGVAVSADGQFVFVDARDSQQVAVYDVSTTGSFLEPVARVDLHERPVVAAEILRGRQLFNDAQDPRLTRDGYIACAHCHLDGESDRRVWDFTHRGEGLRNTTSLLGRAGTGDGPLHWTANFDEVQDFENAIREHFGGTGLMEDGDFAVGTRADPLGDPKAGVSDDLDALAAYVGSLNQHLPSPYRGPGGITPDSAAGAALFSDLGCDGCHVRPRYTDSAVDAQGEPVLHDVGTLTAASGMRSGEPLTGLDTPTLRGVWNSPPYLHDGSAATLEEVLTTRNADDAHGATSTLSVQEIVQLVAFLRSLDHR